MNFASVNHAIGTPVLSRFRQTHPAEFILFLADLSSLRTARPRLPYARGESRLCLHSSGIPRSTTPLQFGHSVQVKVSLALIEDSRIRDPKFLLIPHSSLPGFFANDACKEFCNEQFKEDSTSRF